MEYIDFDVIVAGAGPSGCAAAIALQLAGLRVCLVDKENAGGRKVGESLPGATIRLLRRLGIDGIGDLLDEKNYKVCRSNASAWGDEEWVYESGLKNPEGGGHHINRAVFNEALRTKAVSAGVTFYMDTIDIVDALQYEDENQGFTIQFKNKDSKVNTKWIIDATGRKTAIARKFGLKRQRMDRQMSAVNWITAPTTDQDHATRIKSVPDGWWYTSLLPDKSRVTGFQGLPDTVSMLYKDPSLYFERFNQAGLLPYTIGKESLLQSTATEAGLAKCESAVAHRLICVGDAALSFDPLSSQGIFFALYSGIKGAEAIINCIGDNQKMKPELSRYQSMVERIFAENKKSLHYFYSTELRYAREPYWKDRREGSF